MLAPYCRSPEVAVIKYHNIYDTVMKVRNYISKDSPALVSITSSIKDIKTDLSKFKGENAISRSMRSNLENLLKMKRSLIDGAYLQNFDETMMPLLMKHYSLIADRETPSEQILEIVEDILIKLQYYININITRPSKNDIYCKCHKILSREKNLNNDGNLSCEVCGFYLAIPAKTSSVVSDGKMKTGNDPSRENFIKTTDLWLGKKKPSIKDDTIMEKLDQYFAEKRIRIRLDGERDKYGIVEGTSHKELLRILKVCGYGNIAKSAFYIGHIYWNWDLPEIKDYDYYLKVYDILQSSFRNIKVKDRKSSINVMYMMYRIRYIIDEARPSEHFKLPDKYEKNLNPLFIKMLTLARNDLELLNIDVDRVIKWVGRT